MSVFMIARVSIIDLHYTSELVADNHQITENADVGTEYDLSCTIVTTKRFADERAKRIDFLKQISDLINSGFRTTLLNRT